MSQKHTVGGAELVINGAENEVVQHEATAAGMS